MSCRLPVVVPRQGALPELVEDGRGGFVCDPGDREAFARRLVELLHDAPLRQQFGRWNGERVDKFFRWDRAARETRQIYEEVLRQWRERRRT
jgi:glycosyltransferase involved in cell wall biosynthesis